MFAAHENPHGSQDITKEFFFTRFRMRQALLYLIKNSKCSAVVGHQISLKGLSAATQQKIADTSSSFELNRKGQKRIFFVCHNKKGISIIF